MMLRGFMPPNRTTKAGLASMFKASKTTFFVALPVVKSTAMFGKADLCLLLIFAVVLCQRQFAGAVAVC